MKGCILTAAAPSLLPAARRGRRPGPGVASSAGRLSLLLLGFGLVIAAGALLYAKHASGRARCSRYADTEDLTSVRQVRARLTRALLESD